MPQQPSLITKLAPSQEQAWFSLLRVHAQVLRHVEADLLASHQLTFSTAEILCHLRVAERPQSVNDIAGRLVSVTATRASRLIQQLVDHGYVHRSSDQADGRISLVSLTPAGERFALTVSNTLKDSIAARYVASLDEADLAAMARIWQKVNDANERTTGSVG